MYPMKAGYVILRYPQRACPERSEGVSPYVRGDSSLRYSETSGELSIRLRVQGLRICQGEILHCVQDDTQAGKFLGSNISLPDMGLSESQSGAVFSAFAS